MAARRNGGGGRDGLWANIQRALFLRRLHRLQEEEPLPGAAPRLDRRQRKIIRALLAKPKRTWTIDAISKTFLLTPTAVADLGADLFNAGLAYVHWVDGRRCFVLTEVGLAELPAILELYRSQSPFVVLFRRGPRSAAILWWIRHRDRVWRRARKRELPPAAERDEANGGDSGLLW